MDTSADSTVELNKCICSTGFIFIWIPQNYFMEENFLFHWIHVPSSTVTINSVSSSGLAHSFMAQRDITNDYLATQSHVMTLQKLASVETVWIYLDASVCLCPSDPCACSLHRVWSPGCIHYLSLQRPFETQISCHAESLFVAHTFKYVDDFLWDSVEETVRQRNGEMEWVTTRGWTAARQLGDVHRKLTKS